jgi:hypothetical protein
MDATRLGRPRATAKGATPNAAAGPMLLPRFEFPPDARKRVVRPLRLMLQAKGHDPSEAEAIVSRLEAVVEMGSWHLRKPHDPAALVGCARALLDAFNSLPIGSPDEIAATRRVLSRIVRVYSRKRGRPRHKRRGMFQSMVLDVLKDAGLAWKRNESAAEVLAVVEGLAFGETTRDKGKLDALVRAVRRKNSPKP